jgi:bestrophin-3
MVVYSRAFHHNVPITFVLGFYVSLVMNRWWAQFLNIAWPDTLVMHASTLIAGMVKPHGIYIYILNIIAVLR